MHLVDTVPNSLSTLEITSELCSETGIALFEQVAIALAEELIRTRAHFACAVHLILEHELYRYAYDSSGENFRIAEDYLKDLSGRCFVGVSTMWGYHSAIKLARSLGYSGDDILQRGIYIFTEVSKLVIKDRRTGAPVRLRDSSRQPADLGDYLVETIDELSTNSSRPDIVLRPSEFRTQLESRLKLGRPQIHFQRGRDGVIRWYYERTRDDGMLDFYDGIASITLTGSPPVDVLEAVYNKLYSAMRIPKED